MSDTQDDATPEETPSDAHEPADDAEVAPDATYAVGETTPPPAQSRPMKPEDKRFLLGLVAGLLAGALIVTALIAVPAMVRGAFGARRGHMLAQRGSKDERGRMMGREGQGYGRGYGYGQGEGYGRGGQGNCPYQDGSQTPMPRGWRFKSQPTTPTL